MNVEETKKEDVVFDDYIEEGDDPVKWESEFDFPRIDLGGGCYMRVTHHCL